MYCEKIMVSDEEQETPMHFHWAKTEDIINRGGGNLVMELYMATEDDKLSEEPVTVSIDGVLTTVKAGEPLILKPGQSICLKSRVYHRFYGEKGKGWVLIGEVSLVNDDAGITVFMIKLADFLKSLRMKCLCTFWLMIMKNISKNTIATKAPRHQGSQRVHRY